ncbi:MAG: DUF2269 domain-containing protein [Actinomycetota bacterium]|nr:DUF2269 domain-containing protein [Actinomycetota bacterium]
MTLPPPLRKAVLTTHVITSVGWLGALAAYLALDVAAATSRDADVARGAYVAMEVVVLWVIVPLALASLRVGVINALGTTWGLFRHWWVVAKLLLTLVATLVLLVQVPGIESMAAAARSVAAPGELPGTLPHSIGGLVVLVVVTMLSTYKPRGLTRYGWRRQHAERGRQRGEPTAVRP